LGAQHFRYPAVGLQHRDVDPAGRWRLGPHPRRVGPQRVDHSVGPCVEPSRGAR